MRGRVRYRGEDGAREPGEPTLENLRPAIMSDGLRSTISITSGGWAGARCRVKQGGAGGCGGPCRYPEALKFPRPHSYGRSLPTPPPGHMRAVVGGGL